MSGANFTEEAFSGSQLSMASPTSLPVIGLTIVVAFLVYLGVKTYHEFSQENKLKRAMYEETGIESEYSYRLPVEEKQAYQQLRAYLLFLKANGKAPEQGAKLEISVEKARDLIRNKLTDEERKKIRMALVRWMIGTIEVLAKVEKDRPGAARLYDKKLVSEEYWAGVQSCFQDTHETIQAINGEAEFLEEGLGSQIFQQALQLWRITKVREQQRSGESSAARTPQG
jgi:hypothetical protein